jgi:hypothetical protein
MTSSASQGIALKTIYKNSNEVLRQLCDAGLKVNTEKSTFFTLEIEYLGSILTRDGI